MINAVANPSLCLSVVCDVRAPYSRVLTFRKYFAPYCSLAIRQLTHQKSRRSSKGITPSEQISLTGVWLCDSSKVAKPPISSSHVWLSHLMSILLLAPEAVWQVGRSPYQSDIWYGGVVIRRKGRYSTPPFTNLGLYLNSEWVKNCPNLSLMHENHHNSSSSSLVFYSAPVSRLQN